MNRNSGPGSGLIVSRPLQIVALVAALVALVLAYDVAYTTHGFTPNEHESVFSWQNWWDQSKYLESARAFAALDLSKAHHLYPMGYPLMAAPFVTTHPLDPFYPVNLACFLVLAAALVALGVRLGLGPLAGLLAMLIGVMWPADLFGQYLVPWTTSPVAALFVISLSVYARSMDAGLSIGRATALGAALAVVIATRPVDAVALVPLYLHLVWSEWQRRRTSRAGPPLLSPGPVIAGSVTAALLLGAYLALHFAVHGAQPGAYMNSASNNLLQPTLIPLRFLLLFNDPRDIYGEGVGILERYPAVAVGLIGLAYTAAFSRYRAVSLVVLVSLAVYLSYVEFLPTGLWWFGNLHYLKWMFPVLFLLALAMAKDILISGRWKRGLLACALVIPFCLVGVGARTHVGTLVENAEGMDLLVRTESDRRIFALRFSDVRGDFDKVYMAHHRLHVDGQLLQNTLDFKSVPTARGAIVVLHKPKTFRQARLEIQPESRVKVGGQVEVVEPVLAFKNPFRCDTVTAFDLRLC